MLRRTAVAVALSGGLLAGCGPGPAAVSAGAPGASATTRVAFHGMEPDPVPPRPSFVLTDLDGQRYDFAARTGGRPTYLYFGYTHCPDECPTAMADLAASLRRADDGVRSRAMVVFVTTDPARDTPPVLRRWLGKFSPAFVGLVGSAADLAAAQRAAGVEPARKGGLIPTLPGHPDQHPHAPGAAPHTHDGPLGYGVEHSDVIFAYDAADRNPVVYPGGSLPSDIAADLPALARKETS